MLGDVDRRQRFEWRHLDNGLRHDANTDRQRDDPITGFTRSAVGHSTRSSDSGDAHRQADEPSGQSAGNHV